MAVHYPKALMRDVKARGLRLVTIDCGAQIQFQGGCTPEEHMDLVRLVEHLSLETVKRTVQPPSPATNGHTVDRLPPNMVCDECGSDRAGPMPQPHDPKCSKADRPMPKKRKRGRPAKSR